MDVFDYAAQGLSQSEIARRIGVSRQAVNTRLRNHNMLAAWREAHRIFREKAMTDRAVARLKGTCAGGLYELCLERGLPVRVEPCQTKARMVIADMPVKMHVIRSMHVLRSDLRYWRLVVYSKSRQLHGVLIGHGEYCLAMSNLSLTMYLRVGRPFLWPTEEDIRAFARGEFPVWHPQKGRYFPGKPVRGRAKKVTAAVS